MIEEEFPDQVSIPDDESYVTAYFGEEIGKLHESGDFNQFEADLAPNPSSLETNSSPPDNQAFIQLMPSFNQINVPEQENPHEILRSSHYENLFKSDQSL